MMAGGAINPALAAPAGKKTAARVLAPGYLALDRKIAEPRGGLDDAALSLVRTGINGSRRYFRAASILS
jgi:hypothetical protein